MKRVIRQIRNKLFPHKHNKIVYEIKYYQSYIKAIKAEINKYNKMMEYGYLGDTLWQKYHWLHDNMRYAEKHLLTLKNNYKQQVKMI